MNYSMSGPGMGFLALLAILFSFVTTVFWLVIGWRAMRAHERIADVLEQQTPGLRTANRPDGDSV
jgi:uncharacterized membrane protein